jgi:amino acid transporter
MTKQRSNKALSVFSLVMINIIAVDSLRSLPIGAEYGFAIVFWYILAGLFFLIPTALVAAELATGWPQTGGIYIWLREAFGKQVGFIVVWLQWLYNIFWYPTIMSLLAATLAYIFAPDLAHNKAYMLTMILLFFWGATFANWFGMQFSGWVSGFASIVGTLLPMAVIIILASIWLITGHHSEITFTWKHFLPAEYSPHSLALLSMILFGLIGMEMSAIHAGDVKQPQRDYPRALLFSSIIILTTLILGSLALAIIIPQAKIELSSGLMEGFQLFFSAFHLKWMTPILAVLIIIGGFGGVSAWVIGPTKAIMIAAKDGAAPSFFKATNKYQVPSRVLIVQGVITTLLSLLFVYMPNLNSAFTLLSAITSELALIVYIGIFAAAIKLRFSQPNVKRAFKMPFGNKGLIIVASVAIVVCTVVFLFGLLPPQQIYITHKWLYSLTILIGVGLALIVPLLLKRL